MQFGPGKEFLQKRLGDLNIPAMGDMLAMAVESGVKLIGCQMTMDLMGISSTDFIDGVEVGGAMTFLDWAYDANVTITF